jgi:glycolate oxidase FAD binding subunit
VVNFLQLEQITNNHTAVRIHASSGVGKLQLEGVKPEIIEQLRTYCQANQGFLTILEAPQVIKAQLDVWGYQGNDIKTIKAIKNQFDPQNILNCDRFIV